MMERGTNKKNFLVLISLPPFSSCCYSLFISLSRALAAYPLFPSMRNRDRSRPSLFFLQTEQKRNEIDTTNEILLL